MRADFVKARFLEDARVELGSLKRLGQPAVAATTGYVEMVHARHARNHRVGPVGRTLALPKVHHAVATVGGPLRFVGSQAVTMPVPSHFNSVEAIKIHCYMVSQPKSAEKGVTPEEVRLKRIPPILLLLKDAYEAHLSFLKPLLKSGRLFGSSCFG